MEGFIKGDVVIIPFPFSDLTQAKRRPALVLATLTGDDIILCQITSQNVKDKYAIPIDNDDFTEGTLKRKSNIRPNRIFTADRKIIIYKAGHILEDKRKAVLDMLFEILR
jgi:mRNA interferase MazF